MVKWAATIPDESIVIVEGKVQLPIEEVKSASIGNIEILISQVGGESFRYKSIANAFALYSYSLSLLPSPVSLSRLKMLPALRLSSRKKTSNSLA